MIGKIFSILMSFYVVYAIPLPTAQQVDNTRDGKLLFFVPTFQFPQFHLLSNLTTRLANSQQSDLGTNLATGALEDFQDTVLASPSLAEETAEGFFPNFGQTLSSIPTSVGTAVLSFPTTVGNGFSSIQTSVGNGFSSIQTSVGNAFGSIRNRVQDFVDDLPQMTFPVPIPLSAVGR